MIKRMETAISSFFKDGITCTEMVLFFANKLSLKMMIKRMETAISSFFKDGITCTEMVVFFANKLSLKDDDIAVSIQLWFYSLQTNYL